MKSFFLLTSILSILAINLSAQTTDKPLDNTLKNLATYSQNDAPEKVYIHTDKNLYGKHETIWYAAYLLNGISHTAGTDSDVINVELRNKIGEVLKLQELYAPNGFANGNFTIDGNWKDGQYSVVAYTNYMLGDEKEYIFQKTINISSAEKLDSIYTAYTIVNDENNPSTISKPEIKFFPEGGDLIHDLKTRIAVKINTDNTQSFKGEIYDDNNSLVAQFKTYNYGYGLFDFTPDENKTYTAKVSLNNQTFKYNLPKTKPSGAILNILNKRDFFLVQIKSSSKINTSNLNLVAHNRGLLFLVKSLSPTDSSNEINLQISKKDLPNGIVQFTLFDELSNPISERMVFVENENKYAQLEVVSTIKNPSQPRSQVNMDIKLKSLIDSIQNSKSRISMSVIESSAYNLLPSQTNIKSWMLLNSDLRGEIKDAAYFFTEKNMTKRDYILDIVLMTHGWRRFDWKVLNSENYTNINTAEKQKGLYIKGQTTKWMNKKKGVKSKVNLVFLDNQFTEENIVTDENGNFEFGPYVCLDTLSGILQVRKYNKKKANDKLAGKKTVNINLLSTQKYVALEQKDNYYIKNEKSITDQSTYLEQAIYSENIYAQENLMSVELDEFVITAKSLEEESEIEKVQRSQAIYLDPSKRLIPKDIDRASAISIFDLIRRIPGVRVTGSFPNQSVNIGGPTSFSGGGSPIYIYNGTQVPADYISSIAAFDVLFIDVLTGAQAAIFGANGANGVIAIYTGRTNSEVKRKTPGITDFKFNGFYNAAEFYSPNYSIDYMDNSKPDYRSTLYWNPNISLNKNESVNVKFFTTDEATNTYKVVIEGVDDIGNLIFEEIDLK